MRLYSSASSDAPTLVLAHGAGAGHDHPWMRRVAHGLADRGVAVVTFNFPYTEAGRKLPDRGPVLEAAFVSVWETVAASAAGRPMFAGGKSMGGRMASQAAARQGFTPAPAGLVFFGYPLHPPAKPDKRRDKHLATVDVPMLFLSGTKDPFGSPEELRTLVAGQSQNGRPEGRPLREAGQNGRPEGRPLRGSCLELFEGGDHSIVAGKRADPMGQLLERAMDIAAEWILRT